MHIAKTIAGVSNLSDPLARAIMDRSKPLSEMLVSSVIEATTLSWVGRRPKPVRVADNKSRTSDLDLLSVMMDLYRRQATITLPQYDNRTPWVVRSAERQIGSARRGRIMGLISHHKHLSFGVRIEDQSVVDTAHAVTKFGAPRTFMLADYDGVWHEGWAGFTWELSDAERSFFVRRKQVVDGGYAPGDYVHLERRKSLFGRPYLLAKLLLQRIEDEVKHLAAELKRLDGLGIVVKNHSPAKPVLASGSSKVVIAPTFTVDLDHMDFIGSYAAVAESLDAAEAAHGLLRRLRYELRPQVQFIARAAEVAFCRFGLAGHYTAPWVRGVSWKQVDESTCSIGLTDLLTLTCTTGVEEITVAAPKGPLPQDQRQRISLALLRIQLGAECSAKVLWGT